MKHSIVRTIFVVTVVLAVAFFVQALIVYGNGNHDGAFLMLLVEAVLLLTVILVVIIISTGVVIDAVLEILPKQLSESTSEKPEGRE